MAMMRLTPETDIPACLAISGMVMPPCE